MIGSIVRIIGSVEAAANKHVTHHTAWVSGSLAKQLLTLMILLTEILLDHSLSSLPSLPPSLVLN